MSDRYFDDFQVGEVFATPGITISEAQILEFALKYDPQPFHLDTEAAARSPYGGLIASGFQTLALTFRCMHLTGTINACSIGSPGFDALRWLLPVRPGDTLSAEATVKEVRPSKSKPDRGIIVVDYATRNQHGETVMTFTAMHLLLRKAG